jgi:hypothetical protein
VADYHTIFTHETFACGLHTEDGFETRPCPYGPYWPTLEEFEIECKKEGRMWFCTATPKTKRARMVGFYRSGGATKDKAEKRSKRETSPKKNGEPLYHDDLLSE